jgi:geranyl-CoA carboxylase alpha subunit
MSAFGSILVANRGEIALRIMRTARALGYRTIAVYSDADAEAPHVTFADEAVMIGAAPVAESYMNVERLLDAARSSGADAVHPGYGFLSENAEFARACVAAGLVFIGPPADAIALMGNKAEAKRQMLAAGVPCVPGYEGRDQSDATLDAAAFDIGYPIMIKAAAGGGGRGMRLVEAQSELSEALGLARSEAQNAFGSDEVILEKAIQRPRHVEIQVFADRHGSFVHLGERDCSVQRRHQKLVEEAPCPVLTEALRAEMGVCAVEVARSIGYEGAGTVEFLLDREGAYYFLEMNTRLQVEHPVTEMVTGRDLVALQIAVAQGAHLGFGQDDVSLRGHAIEVRLYAEDPAQNFMPASGRIELWREAVGGHVRTDAGIRSGLEVSPHYDAMLAKVIAWGETRDEARRRLTGALAETVLFGPSNNKQFLTSVLENDIFASGAATTAFIAEEFGDGLGADKTTGTETAAIGAVLQYCDVRDAMADAAVAMAGELLNWSSSAVLASKFPYRNGATEFEVLVRPRTAHAYDVTANGDSFDIECFQEDAGQPTISVNSVRRRVIAFHTAEARLYVALDGETAMLEMANGSGGGEMEAHDGGRVVAPMHGNLVEVCVEVGAEVARGARLAVLEAMKMQHEIIATADGIIAGVHGRAGEQAAAGDLLFEIATAHETAENRES